MYFSNTLYMCSGVEATSPEGMGVGVGVCFEVIRIV